MKSKLAESLSSDRIAEMRKLSADERFALAFALGEQAVRIYASSNGVSEEHARRVLRRNKQSGRRFSRVLCEE